MTPEDIPRLDALLTAMFVAFDKAPPSDTVTQVYFLALKSLTIETVERRVNEAIAWSGTEQQRFLPKPGELRAPADSEHQAVEAYRIASDAMHQHGSYKHVDFEDKAINATIRALGGWVEFGELRADDEPYYRARFLKTYAGYCRNGVSEEAGRVLAGIGEATRVQREKGKVIGTKIEPVRIAAPSSRPRLEVSDE